MSKRKSPQEERATILSQPQKRPYGAKVHIRLQTSGPLGFVEEVCVPLQTGAFLAIAPARSAPWEGGNKYLVTLEGFATAAAAEAAGRRLVQALLWMAISTDSPLRLEYLSYQPASVFERTASGSSGILFEGCYAVAGRAPELVLGELQEAYVLLPEPDETLLLSMEVFCSARLEASQRAIFLAIVSALEPLAREAPLGDEVNRFVTDSIARLNDSEAIPSQLRKSLEGRLLHLRRESVRQALKRLVRETLPHQPDAALIVDEAYALRSQLVHSGLPRDLDVDLDREAQIVSHTIRAIYARLLNRSLALAPP
ncbi:MAG: hypothetical protein KDI45_09910 [Candidatus Accumulibacter sp.]|nr:hypothetical protein [Accumulibacter sp.]MCB1967531.1 hypothetical protein [Accumulibacter sp.]